MRNSQPVTIDDMSVLLSLKHKLQPKIDRVKSRLNRRSRTRSRRVVVAYNQEAKQLRKIKLLRLAVLMGFGGLLAGMMMFFILLLVYAKDMPQPGQVVRQTGFSTKLFDRNGVPLQDLYTDENRIFVPIEQMPQHLKDATVAIEDKDFYSHRGFDLMVFVRAPYYLLTEGRVVGGSTLTQQLVKKVLLTDERSLARKFKQIVLSLLIERRFSKDEILEMYLNEVPYGGTAYGVGAAAEQYFNKPVSELTQLESAILAGLPQRPSAYSPYAAKTDDDGKLLWQLRAEGVLRRMQEDGYLSSAAYTEAVDALPNVTFSKGGTNLLAPHFVYYAKDQLEEMFGEDLVNQGGLQVTTSLDMTVQEEAQKVVAEEIDKVQNLNITNGAVIVMNPKTGEVISMVGSKDFNSQDMDGQFNVVTQGLRQPGSSIKPVVYLTLMQNQQFTPASMMVDVPTTFQRNDAEKPYAPKNYDGKFRGPVSLRNSLGSSLNIPAVKALAYTGLESFLQQAYKMGFATLEPTKENLQRLGLSVALGGGEVHLIDSATAFSSFANTGVRVEPISILKVVDKNGRVLFEHRPVEGERVMEPEYAFLINDILSDDQARAMAFGTNSRLNVSPNIAVKTGTTNDQRDNWAIGWSQDVLVGAWVGNNDNSAMKTVASGISGATPIWQRIMEYALKNGYEAPAWEVPSGVEQVEVDAISGYYKHDEFPTKAEYVVKGSLPKVEDAIHRKIKLCRGENKLATDAKIAAGDYDEKEFVVLAENDPYSQDGKNRFQEAISSWIAGLGNILYQVPTEFCGDNQDLFVNLKRPENEKTYDGEDIEVEVVADSGAGIDKLEIMVDGSIKETIKNREYKGKIRVPRGRHEVWVIAYSRDGKTATSEKHKIGTGGESWQEPTPTPVPTATPTPLPTTPPAPPTATPVPVIPTTTPVLPSPT